MRISQWRYLVAGVVAAAALTASGCGKRTVATVNGEKISQDAFYKRMQRHPVSPQVQFPPPIESQVATVVLNQMIYDTLTLELAKKENVLPTQEQLDQRKKELSGALGDRGRDLTQLLQRASMTHKELDERLTPEMARSNLIAKYVKVTDEEVKKEYERMTSALPAEQKIMSPYYLPTSVHVFGILNSDKNKILEAKKQLANGVAFSVVAEQYSTDNFTKARRGEIGWIEMPDQMRRPIQGVPREFYINAFNTKAGTNTEPFMAGGDWVILRVEERREARMQPFEHVKGVVRDGLLLRKSADNEKVRKMFENMRKEAKIDVKIPGYREFFKQAQERMEKEAESVTQKTVPANPGAGKE